MAEKLKLGRDALPWVKWWVREPREGSPYGGRCELVANHAGDHALERGMDAPRWSTEWTS